tara:strand:- start:554 stop:916 length:363 start_codon:yes stop_codon:yes gene_type:complete
MDGGLLVRFFTTYAICVGLVIAVPRVIAGLFPALWVEDPMELKGAFGLVYLIASWGFLGWRDVITHHPEDMGFTGYGFHGHGIPNKPLLLRVIVSTFCLLVSFVSGLSPIIGMFLAQPYW